MRGRETVSEADCAESDSTDFYSSMGACSPNTQIFTYNQLLIL
jgi:hypothetical protein